MTERLVGERGFSLIEVLVGLVILAVGILAIAGLQVASIRGTAFGNSLREASVLAQERMEFLKSLDLSTAPELQTGDHKDVTRGIFQGRYSAVNNGTYATIRYTVEWVERNTNHHIALATIKSR